MDIDSLQAGADDEYWKDPETVQPYPVGFPLLADDSTMREGERLSEGIPGEKVERIGPFVVCTSSPIHVGPFRYAVDFLVPDGTPVFAAVSGTIVKIIECYDVWGPTEEYANRLNYITIEGDDGVYTQYLHLAKESVTAQGLKVGDCVEAGQRIAIVGKTGRTDRDHLHFMAYRHVEKNSRNQAGFRSIKVQFVPSSSR